MAFVLFMRPHAFTVPIQLHAGNERLLCVLCVCVRFRFENDKCLFGELILFHCRNRLRNVQRTSSPAPTVYSSNSLLVEHFLFIYLFFASDYCLFGLLFCIRSNGIQVEWQMSKMIQICMRRAEFLSCCVQSCRLKTSIFCGPVLFAAALSLFQSTEF